MFTCARGARFVCRSLARASTPWELQQHHDLFDNSLWWKKDKKLQLLFQTFSWFIFTFIEKKTLFYEGGKRSAKKKVQEFDYAPRDLISLFVNCIVIGFPRSLFALSRLLAPLRAPSLRYFTFFHFLFDGEKNFKALTWKKKNKINFKMQELY